MKGPDLYTAPRYAFDNAAFAICDGDDIANLKWLIGLQCNAREQVSERILQGKTDNYSENGRTAKQGTKLNAGILRLKDYKERDDVDNYREDRF